jgi:SAM-dependent methyltransferase
LPDNRLFPVCHDHRMLAELLARSGQKVLRGVPPDGRNYWEARFWDRDAAENRSTMAEVFVRQRETISEHLRQYGGQTRRALELACGTGEFTFQVATLTPAKEIVALDISPLALELARSRIHHENLTLVQGDFWADHDFGTADLVLCIDAIHHLGDVRAVLERLRSFIAPGGLFIGNLWTADHFHEFQRKRYGTLRHVAGTAAFLATALVIRLSGGRLRTGAYRTQLLPQRAAEAIVRSVFDEVLTIRTERYFMSFVCRG